MKYRIAVNIRHISDLIAPRQLIIEVEAPSEAEALSEALEKAKYINAEELHNRNFSFDIIRKE